MTYTQITQSYINRTPENKNLKELIMDNIPETKSAAVNKQKNRIIEEQCFHPTKLL